MSSLDVRMCLVLALLSCWPSLALALLSLVAPAASPSLYFFPIEYIPPTYLPLPVMLRHLLLVAALLATIAALCSSCLTYLAEGSDRDVRDWCMLS
jgi:hypothetical protein